MSKRTGPFLAWPGWEHLRYATLLSVAGVLWFVIVYGAGDAFTAHRTLRMRVHLQSELEIPFIPEMALVYMSIYLLFLAAPFIVCERPAFLALCIRLNLVILVAGICFLLFPAQLAFAPPKNLGAFPGAYRFADALNLTYNLLPSLHVALSVACISTFAARTGAPGKGLLWVWAGAIAASTLLTHQHHLLDVVTGWGLGLAPFKSLYLRTSNFPTIARRRSTP